MTDRFDPTRHKLGAFGLPYHGAVRAGKLTLSNGETIDYPQPAMWNTLLSAIPGLPRPERSADAVAQDAAKGYDWKDRLLINSTLADEYQIIYTAPDGKTWILDLSTPTWSGVTFAVDLSVVTRFGVLYVPPIEKPAPLNHVFWTSPPVTLDPQQVQHLGVTHLNDIRISQSPDGGKVLVIIGAQFANGEPIPGESEVVGTKRTLAGIYMLTISGDIDPQNDTWPTVSIEEWKSLEQCSPFGQFTVDDTTVIKHFERTTETHVTCSANTTCNPESPTPVKATTVYTETGQLVEGSGSTEITVGRYRSETIQTCIIGAFFDEDGNPHTIGWRAVDLLDGDSTATYTYNKSVTTVEEKINYQWTCTRGDYMMTQDGSWSEDYLHTGWSIYRQEYAAQIDGETKERIVYQENGTFSRTYSDGDVISESFSQSNYPFTQPCIPGDSTRTFGIDKTYMLNNLTISGSDRQTIEAGGSIIYDEPWQQNQNLDVPQVVIIGNRLVGLNVGGLITDLGYSGNWGAHTDRAGISGPVGDYASYDPYTQTVETSDDPVGFV